MSSIARVAMALLEKSRDGDYEQQLGLMLDSMKVGMVQHDLCRQQVSYDEDWLSMLGYEPGSAVDATPSLWRDLSHPDDLRNVDSAWRAHTTSGEPFDRTWRLRHRDGAYRWLQCRSAARVVDGNPTEVVSLYSDVTERVEEARRHRALVRAIPDTMLRMDTDGTLLDLHGGRSATVDSLLNGARVGAPVSEGGLPRDICEQILSVVADALYHERTENFDRKLTLEGGVAHLEFRVAPASAREVVCLIRDVSDRRQLESRLMEARKLEGIGQLAAGVAHEINTPLQYIGDNARFVATVLKRFLRLVTQYREAVESHPDEALREAVAQAEREAKLPFFLSNVIPGVESCIDGVDRVRQIVVAMKDFAHPGGAELVSLDVNRALRSSARVSVNEWRHCCELELDLCEQLPSVLAYAGEVQQCFLNLIVNAAHALAEQPTGPDTGRIWCRTRAWQSGVEIEIQDNGPGMPPAIKERIFEPFFTTKEVGKGTGQGLYLAFRTIVERHEGEIFCETAPGQGAKFVVRLHAHPPSRPNVATRSETTEAQRPRKVLVVDDNRVNRQVLGAMLKKLDFQVEAVADGIEAVNAWQKGGVDCILMDLHMPNCSGLDAIELIRDGEKKQRHSDSETKRVPEAPTLGSVAIAVVSNDIDCADRARAATLGVEQFLDKPCSVGDLRACVAALFPEGD